jgi:hypothetical protein
MTLPFATRSERRVAFFSFNGRLRALKLNRGVVDP